MKILVQKMPITDDDEQKNEIETPEIIGGDGGGMKKILLFFLFMISVINSYSQTFDRSILTSGKWKMWGCRLI